MKPHLDPVRKKKEFFIVSDLLLPKRQRFKELEPPHSSPSQMPCFIRLVSRGSRQIDKIAKEGKKEK